MGAASGCAEPYAWTPPRPPTRNAEAYFCAGAAGIFALHLLVNVGMVAGALPNKAWCCPFFSAGEQHPDSFLALGLIMGILIDRG